MTPPRTLAGRHSPAPRVAGSLGLCTSGPLSLGLGLLRETATIVSFITILWTVSGPLALTLHGTQVSIPGYMVWAVLIYAIAGSAITYYVGRPLIRLNFEQERLEADFRFNLVRMREYADGVALYGGEATEQSVHLARPARRRPTWCALMHFTHRLGPLHVRA